MKILITGGTGLIGTEISKQLLEKNHEVVYLSRHPGKNDFQIREFAWNPGKGEIDTSTLDGVDAIVNLAGASLNKRWTPQYKNTILRSRVDSTRLLYTSLEKNSHQVKTLVSASAVGYYPHDYQRSFNEGDPPGRDFLSTVCQKWEQEAQHFTNLGLRVVRCRIGIVLSEKGGALAEMAKPARLGLGSPLGSGKQWMAWIHLSDVAGIFIKALEDEKISGVVNTVGPENVTNAQLIREVAKVLQRPFMMPNVPAWALKLALGEMSRIVLISNKVGNDKIASAGYTYRFTDLQAALRDLLK